MTYAPSAILRLFADIQAGLPHAENSGIVGDRAHSFGYHLSRDDLNWRGEPNDYSLRLAPDRSGDSSAASALDIKPGGETSSNTELMIVVTKRLLAAAKAHDPRLHALREFCGTTDGNNTHPYDLSNGQDGPLNSWDSSHLWHIHLSFYREYANNYAALAPIASVIAGLEDDMTPDQANQLNNLYVALFKGGPSTPHGLPLVTVLGAVYDALFNGGTSMPEGKSLPALVAEDKAITTAIQKKVGA